MTHFIRNIIAEDIASGKTPKIVLRFPPEPNGYLHLGHAKSILLNSELAKEFGGELNLRFDDTNPEKETEEYVRAIEKDAFWLVNNFTRICRASDYFDKLYDCAITLIHKELAYVDDSSMDKIKEARGDFNHLGTDSPYRSRTVAENLELFESMRAGKFENGAKVLRARIDMAHPNLNMRDPVLYRIKHVEHHNTGNKWCIYPMYDFAHPLSDGFEGITHSICTLEFEDHRPLYDWLVEHCREHLASAPHQFEFSRLEIEGVTLSKRKLIGLVTSNLVSGWDDPVMPTISGLRKRGITPAILRTFMERCGVSKVNNLIASEIFNESIRDTLGPIVPRTMGILNPVELELINYTGEESFTVPCHPKDASFGMREVGFSSRIYVDKSDVRLTAEKDFWRIYPGNWIRLKHAYNVFIREIVTTADGSLKIIGEVDFDSKNIKAAKVKAKAAIHWLSATDAVPLPFHAYHPIVNEADEPAEHAVEVFTGLVHKDLANVKHALHVEMERLGYMHISENVVHVLAWMKNFG